MNFGSKGLIGILCVCVILFCASTAWAANVDIGPGAKAGSGYLNDDNTAIGEKAKAGNGTGNEDNLAIGEKAEAGNGHDNFGNVAVGNNAKAGNGFGEYGNTAIGDGAKADGINATAIGSNATATAENSVAIGVGSETGDRANTVSVGKPNAERQIINVADGTAPTDAVNVRQLDRLSNRVDKVGSLAAAMSGLAPLSYKAEEPTQGSIAIGRYSGETAIAAGVYHYTKEDVLLNAAFGISGSEKMGRMGVSIRFGKSKDKNAAVTTTAPVATTELKPAGIAISETKINLDEITVSQDDLKSEKAPV